MRISTLAPVIESIIGDSTYGDFSLDECGFLDLGFYGKKFTWFKKYPSSGIWERLNRAVSMAEWIDHFPVTKVRSLVCEQFDHSPIVILLEGILAKPQQP